MWMVWTLVFLLALGGAAAIWDCATGTPTEGDFGVRDFRFRSGDMLADFKPHYGDRSTRWMATAAGGDGRFVMAGLRPGHQSNKSPLRTNFSDKTIDDTARVTPAARSRLAVPSSRFRLPRSCCTCRYRVRSAMQTRIRIHFDHSILCATRSKVRLRVSITRPCAIPAIGTDTVWKVTKRHDFAAFRVKMRCSKNDTDSRNVNGLDRTMPSAATVQEYRMPAPETGVGHMSELVYKGISASPLHGSFAPNYEPEMSDLDNLVAGWQRKVGDLVDQSVAERILSRDVHVGFSPLVENLGGQTGVSAQDTFSSILVRNRCL